MRCPVFSLQSPGAETEIKDGKEAELHFCYLQLSRYTHKQYVQVIPVSQKFFYSWNCLISERGVHNRAISSADAPT